MTWEHLEFLDLSNSLFLARGTIPTELGNLKRLKWLDLSETSFFGRGGPIPSQFGNLESLERLDLRKADLEGKLPSQLGDLANLKWLDISDNWFEGEIPREWMKLKLDYFHWKPIIDDVDLCAPTDEGISGVAEFDPRPRRREDMRRIDCVLTPVFASDPGGLSATQRTQVTVAAPSRAPEPAGTNGPSRSSRG